MLRLPRYDRIIYMENILKNNKKSLSKLCEKNPRWRGDEVGLTQLHMWVKRRLPKPRVCDICKEREPLDLSNKGIYNRELENWFWNCRKCHIRYDGRLEKFLSFRKSFEKGNQLYKLRVDKRGEESPASKLKEKDVVEIRKLFATGKYKQQQLANMFNITFQTIHLIVKRKSWKHI